MSAPEGSNLEVNQIDMVEKMSIARARDTSLLLEDSSSQKLLPGRIFQPALMTFSFIFFAFSYDFF